MHRIPCGKNEAKKAEKRSVVFLQHGLEATSSNFVSNLPNKSLGFMLADSGFDVWMGNVRGNRYSRNHESFTETDEGYWQFSWYDMMKYDLTAMIDKVLEETQQSQLYYVGHSQGTLIMFAKLASDKAFAQKIKKFFALAPIVTVEHIKGLLRYLADYFSWTVRIIGAREFLPTGWQMELFKFVFCNPFGSQAPCSNLLLIISGTVSNQLNETRLPIFLSDLPGGTSTTNIKHWIQLVNSGQFQAYDWLDEDENIKRYGNATPPKYDLKEIDVDMYLYWSPADWLANEKDIKNFLLPNLKKEVSLKYDIRTNSPQTRVIVNEKLNDFNHMDFIWGERAAKEIYKPIIEIIKTNEMSKKTKKIYYV
ncbi:unnamed protein product [Dracunculus medinensis]|uniref:AB hydrolase-1 domain-containing protein n=1 Tax=Dracunculus medinensis TaxID=318479 RepID=A0A0N4UII8_DRAME|nr:unnamed protein product [Dracunculus medinensis]